MKKCNCGGKSFFLTESISYKAEINEQENYQLDIYKNIGNEIEAITCEKCGQDYKENDFENIEFCW